MTFEELLQAESGPLEDLTDEQLQEILKPALDLCPPVALEAWQADRDKERQEKKAKAKKVKSDKPTAKKKRMSELEKYKQLILEADKLIDSQS